MVRIVFVGGGHANSLILLGIFQEKCDLVMVSDGPYAYYSGMIPGLIAKQYTQDQLRIDLPKVCEKHNCLFIPQKAIYINSKEKYVELADREKIYFDIAIVDIGSRNKHISDHIHACTLPTRPLSNLLARLDQIETCQSVTVVGGGCGGIELAFALNSRYPGAVIKLVQHGQILPELSEEARNIVIESCRERNIQLLIGDVVDVAPGKVICRDRQVICSDKQVIESELIVWATGAKPHDMPSDLQKDKVGYFLVNENLQCLNAPHVFGAGDCITLAHSPKYPPKAGVFAVRESEVLIRNMKRIIQAGGLDCELEPYIPQVNFLKILNFCNGTAMSIKWTSFAGRLCWKMKNAIDTGFMKKFSTN